MEITTLTDEQIIQLYWDRDETAIEETDKKYRNYLYTVAYNILTSHEDSEECLSDTYLKTWKTIPPARPGIFRAFLAKITRNTAIDRYDGENRKKRVPLALCEPLSEWAATLPDRNTVEDALEAKAIANIINKYLESVSDRKLYIFMSRYYFFVPARQIAQKLGVSESTVRKELSHMKAVLRRRLLKGGIDL